MRLHPQQIAGRREMVVWVPALIAESSGDRIHMFRVELFPIMCKSAGMFFAMSYRIHSVYLRIGCSVVKLYICMNPIPIGYTSIEIRSNPIRFMLQTTKDNGVSPVIAVLLILAMTVVAAGMVAVVTMGMTGDLQNGKEVGLLVKPAASGGDVLVTIVTGKDVPELTKLEVIDGGSADAVFREVKFLDGSEVMSFTAGAGYVAKNVAVVVNGPVVSSYITPILVRGTFSDGTQSILLHTTISFTNLGFPLGPYLGNLDGYNPIIGNIDLMELFQKGEMTIDTSNVFGNDHELTITATQRNDNTKSQFILYDANGDMIYTAPSPYHPNSTPSVSIYTINNRNKVILTLNVYEPDSSGQYTKLVASQNATIYFTH